MKLIDLTGQTFGSWTVLSRDMKPRCEQTYWVCECKCGNIKSVNASTLRNGKSKGCSDCRMPANRRNLTPEGTAVSRLFSFYKHDAKKSGREFLLTESDFSVLVFAPCNYCGSPPDRMLRGASRYSHKRWSVPYNGIDRINSTKGYSPENVVTSCFLCNRAKNNMKLPDFLEWIQRLVAHHANPGKQV